MFFIVYELWSSMLRFACRLIGIRACSLLTPDPIFGSIQYLDSTHNSILFFQVIYIICRSNINAIFSSGSSSLPVIFSNLAAQTIMLQRLIFQDQKEFFFSNANVLTVQPCVSTLPVATTTLASQVFPPSQSQHPHSTTTPSFGMKLQQTWPLSSCSGFTPQPGGGRRKAGTLSTSIGRNWATRKDAHLSFAIKDVRRKVFIINIQYLYVVSHFSTIRFSMFLSLLLFLL